MPARWLFGFIMAALLLAISLSIPATAQDGEILELLLTKTPQPNYDAAIPAQISGHVLRKEKDTTSGAEGVSVTDGYTVVKTDPQGVYTIVPSPDAVFLYITRPSGHDVVGNWYKPLAAKVDFTIQAAADNEQEFVFVHLTDAHVS